jgi:diaminopimelate epimerase
VARHLGYVRDSAVVHTKGGDLKITFVHDIAFMEGGAETVYEGRMDLDF